jgi:endonuclease/exonuclease/phosphatase family metal-dependent hydrolase
MNQDSSAAADAVLRLASANFESGGIDPGTGDDARWHKTIDALATWAPHVVLCQEIARSGARLKEHLWATANALDMTPLLGPPTPVTATGNHPAILVDSSSGLRILDEGQTSYPPGAGAALAWCEALLEVPSLPHPLRVYSVHLSARSAVDQLSQAQRLASQIAQTGEISIAGGDWNNFSRADASELTPAVLQAMPPHSRPPRMRRLPDGTWEPNFDVHDTLAAIGLADLAASLTPDRRNPPGLTATGINIGGRVDRLYGTEELSDTAELYEQLDTGGSDHCALLLTLRLPAMARIVPREAAK